MNSLSHSFGWWVLVSLGGVLAVCGLVGIALVVLACWLPRNPGGRQ